MASRRALPALVLMVACHIVCHAVVPSRASLAEIAGLAGETILRELRKNSDSQGGAPIFLQEDDSCMSADLWAYKPFLTKGSCLLTDRYEWLFDGMQLLTKVGDDKKYCLALHEGNLNGPVYIVGCEMLSWNAMDGRWRIKVFPQQVDSANERIYFSIMSGLHKDHCLTLRGELKRRGDADATFKLRPCTGARNQSFYFEQDIYHELVHKTEITRRLGAIGAALTAKKQLS